MSSRPSARSRNSTPARSARWPMAEPGSLREAIEAFLLAGDAANHPPATRRVYAYTLERFLRAGGVQTVAETTPDVIQRHLADLHKCMKPVSVHQAFRVLRTFCAWCARTGRLTTDPMAGLTMRVPKTLPRVPDDDAVRRLLAACPAPSLVGRPGDLELVRRGLRHSTLTMALRYATLTQTEIAAKFEVASPLDHLWSPAPGRPRAYMRR